MKVPVLKIVLASVVATLCVVILVLKLFYASILGSFGLVAVGSGTLQSLKASHALVEKVKSRQSLKRQHAKKRFVKRASKKVIASSVAALTLGTVAVAVTAAGLEVEDYCSYLEDIESDQAFLESRPPDFNYEQCAEAARDDLSVLIDQIQEDGKRYFYDTLGIEP